MEVVSQLYLNNYAFFSIRILVLFPQEFRAMEGNSHESCCVIFEDRNNTIELNDPVFTEIEIFLEN